MPVISDSDESDDDSREATHPGQHTREPPRKRSGRKEVDTANILTNDTARSRTRTKKQQLLANDSHQKLQKKLDKTEKELQKMKRQARRDGQNGQPSGNVSSGQPDAAVDEDNEFEEEEETVPMSAASAFTSKGIVVQDTPSPPQKKLKRLYHAPRDDRIDESLPQSDDNESLDQARTKRRSQSRAGSRADDSDVDDRGRGMSTGSRTEEQMPPARSLSPGPLSEPDSSINRHRVSNTPEPDRNHGHSQSLVHSVPPHSIQRRPNAHHEPQGLSVAKSNKQSRRKRRRSPSPAANEPYESIGYINNDVASRSKPNQSDYVTGTKNLIAKAIDIYMVNIYTVDMFPDSLTALGWASNCWKQSCKAAGGRNFDPNDSQRIYRLIMNSASSGRGHLKDKIVKYFPDTYGICEDASKRKQKAENRKCIERLREAVRDGDPARFCYKKWDAEGHPKYYAEPRIVLRGIKEHLFRSAEDLGVVYRTNFDPLPLPLLAAGLTILQHAIDIWVTGQRDTKTTFSEDGYKVKYDQHIAQLTKWTGFNAEATKAVREDLYQGILRSADVGLSKQPGADFSEDAQRQAERDLEDRANHGQNSSGSESG